LRPTAAFHSGRISGGRSSPDNRTKGKNAKFACRESPTPGKTWRPVPTPHQPLRIAALLFFSVAQRLQILARSHRAAMPGQIRGTYLHGSPVATQPTRLRAGKLKGKLLLPKSSGNQRFSRSLANAAGGSASAASGTGGGLSCRERESNNFLKFKISIQRKYFAGSHQRETPTRGFPAQAVPFGFRGPRFSGIWRHPPQRRSRIRGLAKIPGKRIAGHYQSRAGPFPSWPARPQASSYVGTTHGLVLLFMV